MSITLAVTVTVSISQRKGKKGDQGDKGEKGPKGDQGDKGEKGPNGPEWTNGDEVIFFPYLFGFLYFFPPSLIIPFWFSLSIWVLRVSLMGFFLFLFGNLVLECLYLGVRNVSYLCSIWV